MAEARPVQHVLLASVVGLAVLGGYWALQPAPTRTAWLQTIAVVEAAPASPPATLLAQARWLLAHRLARLQGLVGLVGLAALVGGGEGWAWRRQDPQRGLRLAGWTGGVVSLACLPGSLGGLVLLPVPWSLGLVGGLAAGWAIASSWCLLAGRPHVA